MHILTDAKERRPVEARMQKIADALEYTTRRDAAEAGKAR